MGYSNFSTVFDGKSSVARIYNDISSRGHHYDPNQPRVPAGNPDGGQWTADGGYHGTYDRPDDDHTVISDAVPDNDWKPGAQYASRSSRRGGSVGLPTPAQAARLENARSQADKAIRAVREREPDWKPQPGIYSTVEGQIRDFQARAQEAEARLLELSRNGIGYGPFIRGTVPAPEPGHRTPAADRNELNRLGDQWGCHTCGIKDPGIPSGNWHRDHQLPNAFNKFFGREQRIAPQCATCSRRQGGWITNWLWNRKGDTQ